MLLSGGAVLLALTAGADRIPFYWTPLILGLTYLVATLDDATTYAIALGAVGLLNVAGGVYQLTRGGSRAPADA